MSRSYRKSVRCFIACAHDDNREYYKLRRRTMRHKANHEVKNLLAHYGPDGVEDFWKGPCMKTEDQWDEPTDGHYRINWDLLKIEEKRFDEDNPLVAYHRKMCSRYIKSKKFKH